MTLALHQQRATLVELLSLIDEATLNNFREMTVGDFLESLKEQRAARAERHLRPLPSAKEMSILLSERELQVVRLIAEGLANKEISRRLGLSDKTVKNHISHILAKLQLTARTQVAVHALRTGIV
jgi:DNA-binding NarL/FixJ family response regulator